MKDSSEDTEKLLSLAKLRKFTFRPGEHLYKRLSKHLQLCKLHTSQTKQQWFQQAFKEKLEAEKNLCAEDILIEKIIHLKIEEELLQEIEKMVQTIKQFRNFSAKQWMMDAICDKLDREEQEIKRLLHEKINSCSL